jgi:hypothetical protein
MHLAFDGVAELTASRLRLRNGESTYNPIQFLSLLLIMNNMAGAFDPRLLDPDALDSYTWGWMKTRNEPISSEQYLIFAEEDLGDGNSARNLVNAITNAKRALHLRMEDMCLGFGFNAFGGPKSFPRMVDYISRFGIAAPRILNRLNQLRNQVEHDYISPNLQDVETFIDVASLFIAATQRWINRQPSFVEGYQEVTLKGQPAAVKSLSFDWLHGIATLTFSGGRQNESQQQQIHYTCPSEEFFICGRFAIVNEW